MDSRCRAPAGAVTDNKLTQTHRYENSCCTIIRLASRSAIIQSATVKFNRLHLAMQLHTLPFYIVSCCILAIFFIVIHPCIGIYASYLLYSPACMQSNKHTIIIESLYIVIIAAKWISTLLSFHKVSNLFKGDGLRSLYKGE